MNEGLRTEIPHTTLPKGGPRILEGVDGPDRPHWTALSKARLLSAVLGGPVEWLRKLTGFVGILWTYIRWPVVKARLERLRDRGVIDAVPTAAQIHVAGQQQMLGTASDETRVYYELRGIDFTFHNLRRFLDHPASMMDTSGFFAQRDTIVHHILQSTHRHPIYDFQLLVAHEGGLEELRRRTRLALAGEHPRQQRFDLLVEDPTYYARLGPQVERFCDDPAEQAVFVPPDHTGDPLLHLGMDQFKDLRGFCRYAVQLDVGPWDVVKAYGGELWKATLGRLFPRPEVGLQYELFDAALIDRYFPEGLPEAG